MLCDPEQIAPPLGASASPSAKWAAEQLGEERRHRGQGPALALTPHIFIGSGNAAVSRTARDSGLTEPMV